MFVMVKSKNILDTLDYDNSSKIATLLKIDTSNLEIRSKIWFPT
jgi:hypothetical protein